MPGASSRKKGHSFEREVAGDLRSIDPGAKRNLEYQKGGSDIDTSLPYSIQCKPRGCTLRKSEKEKSREWTEKTGIEVRVE
jgi:hypothetical protein